MIGSVKTFRSKPCWYVNERGFISVYALVLLSILLAFTTLFTHSVKTFVNTHTYYPYEYIDLHIIQQIKKEIQQNSIEKQQNSKEEQPSDEPVIIKTSTYKGCLIQYEYIKERVFIQYAYDHITHYVQATYDPLKKIIVQYAYSKEK